MSIVHLNRISPLHKEQENPNLCSFKTNKKLVLHTTDCIRIIPLDQIEFIQGSSNYSYIHLADGTKILVSKTLKELTVQLDSSFLRTHKSFVVNLNFISAYHFREGQLTFQSNKTAQVSRSKKSILKDVFKVYNL